MKKINSLFNLMIFAGILMILGVAGGSDNYGLNILQILRFSLAGLLMIMTGYFGRKYAYDTVKYIIKRRTELKPIQKAGINGEC